MTDALLPLPPEDEVRGLRMQEYLDTKDTTKRPTRPKIPVPAVTDQRDLFLALRNDLARLWVGIIPQEKLEAVLRAHVLPLVEAAQEALPTLLAAAVRLHVHHTGSADKCPVGDCRRFGALRRALVVLTDEAVKP